MQVSDFDYHFPEALIAKYPPKVRGDSRLLVLDRVTGQLTHRRYPDLQEYLQPGDVVVINNTKVVKARLQTKNAAGHERELLLIESHGDDAHPHKRRAIFRGRLEKGEYLRLDSHVLIVQEIFPDGTATIGSMDDLLLLAEQYGAIPLPPYLKRAAEPTDEVRYQTVFADKAGSVAAPTASLNFTDELKSKLQAKGVIIVPLTLHVGLGTFMPIRTDTLEGHQMHSEYFEIPRLTSQAIQTAKKAGKRVIAIGTTVARTLEYAHKDIISAEGSVSGEANIFIYPGYKFKVVDALVTNFHAPKSTVLMLAAAFAGWENLKHAYDEAVAHEYHFLSYGDSMLIL